MALGKLLLLRDPIEGKLEVDEGKQERGNQVEPHIHRFAIVVVVQQLLAQLEDYDDPEEPGEQETDSDNKRSKGPVKRA